MKLGNVIPKELFHRNRPTRNGRKLAPANENVPLRHRKPAPWRRIAAAVFVPLSVPVRRAAAHLKRAVLEEVSRGRVLLLSPIPFGAGASLWFASATEPDSRPLVTMLILMLLLWHATRYRNPLLAVPALMMALAAAGALLAAVECTLHATVLLDRPVTTNVTGRILAREAAGSGRWRYTVQVLSTRDPVLRRAPDEVVLTAREPEPVVIGQVVTGHARLAPPSGPAAPGLVDLSFQAYFSGIGASGFFYGKPHLLQGPETRQSMQGDFWRRASLAFARGRAAIGDRIRSRVAGDEGALAAALITNEQRAISRPAVDALRKSGLAHIIAISGMNMVLASAVFFVGLRSLFSLSPGLCQSLPVKKLAAAGAVLGTAGYFVISGFALSAERAFIMMVMLLFAVLVDRPGISLRSVAISALMILATTPSAGLSASFQLSFSGTLGLVAAYEAWSRRPGMRRNRPRHPALRMIRSGMGFLAGLLATAIVGGLSTALFSLEHFQRLALHGFLANMLVAPLLDFLIMPMALVAVLLMPFGADGLPLTVMGWGLHWVVGIATVLSGAGSEITVRPLPVVIFLLAGFGFVVACVLHTRLRHAGFVLMAAAAILALVFPAPPGPDIVLHEDGALAAILGEGQISPTSDDPDPFLLGQWQRAFARPTVMPPVSIHPASGGREDSADDRYRPLTNDEEVVERALLSETFETLDSAPFACRKRAWCIARLKQTRLAIVLNGIYAAIACDTADIVVARVQPAFTECRSGALLISRSALRKTGSLALTLGADPTRPEIMPSYGSLQRPWLQARAFDWRTGRTDAALPEGLSRLFPHGSGKTIEVPTDVPDDQPAFFQ